MPLSYLQLWVEQIRPFTVWTQSNFFFHFSPRTCTFSSSHTEFLPCPEHTFLFPTVPCTFPSAGKPLIPTCYLPLPLAPLLLVKSLFVLQNQVQVSSLGPLFFLLLKHFHHNILIYLFLWPFPAFCLLLAEFLTRDITETVLQFVYSLTWHSIQHTKEIWMLSAWTWICVWMHMCDKDILHILNKTSQTIKNLSDKEHNSSVFAYIYYCTYKVLKLGISVSHMVTLSLSTGILAYSFFILST